MKKTTILTAAALALAVPAGAWAADDADNSKRNAVDRLEKAVTPGDQGDRDSDIAITRAIRRTVVDRDGFSMNAQNVKIITNGGVVTLRGPVASAEEKTSIASIAKGTSGVKSVDDQLEVETDRKAKNETEHEMESER
jgi:osmotically-inducible protein OsmY